MGFYPFCSINQHNGCISCNESSISIFRKVLMAWGIQEIDLNPMVLKLENAGTTEIPLCFSISIQSEVVCL